MWLEVDVGIGFMLVEVKPTAKFHEAVANKFLRAAQKAEWKGEVMLLGVQPFRVVDGIRNFAFGWMNPREISSDLSDRIPVCKFHTPL